MSKEQFDLDVRISTPSAQKTPAQPNFLTIGSTCGSCGGGYPCDTWDCYSVLYCGITQDACGFTVTCSTCYSCEI